MIEWESCNKLQDLVCEVVLELLSCFLETLLERLWLLLEKFDHLVHIFDFFHVIFIEVLVSFTYEHLVVALRIECKPLSKEVFGPLNTVQRFLWEGLKSTVRNLICFFWILHRAVRLSLVG